MKAMMLTGIREMAMREVEDPRIAGPHDVLVRMAAVGVCGSDIHYYTTGRIGSQIVEYPFTVGHECAGTVEAVGDAVTNVKPGDAVAIEPAITCGTCDQCRAGRSNTCRNICFLGCPGQTAGSLSEYLVMPDACCLPLKPGTSPALGTVSEPLAIGVYAVKRAPRVAAAAIGILGAGPIGLSVLLAARKAGAARIFATDKLAPRLEVARRCGATWTGNPESQDVTADVVAETGTGLDVVFECCGEQEAVDQAVDLLKPGGLLMMIGIPTVDRIAFQIDQMRRKELDFRNVRRQENCTQEALDLIEGREIDVSPMITHTFSFAESRQAFDLVAGYEDGVVKAVIEFP
jgi:L-iditol 2-dehydrogenase